MGLFFNYSDAQILSGQILDSITHKAIEGVNISFLSTRFGVFTDLQGKFKINITNSKDNLLISAIGYKNKNILLSDFNNQKVYETVFYLSPKIEQLDEIIIKNKKTEYTWEKVLKTKRENEIIMGFQFGTENCTYIENPYKKKGKIKSISLDLKKTKGYLINKKYKVDYLAAYNIKFYNYNNKKGGPDTEIYDKNIIIEPENKTYLLKVDLDSLHIDFPENGVCVGVELINTKYINPKQSFAFIGPNMGFSGKKELYPKTSWSRCRYENKFDFEPFTRFMDNNIKKQWTMNVDLVIVLEK